MNGSREAFCQRGRGRSSHIDGSKTEKAWEPTVESLVQGIWTLRVSESEWRVQKNVKLETITGIRWSSACDTFIAESVYLILNSLLDWEPTEKLKQRSYVVSFTCVFSV